MYLLYTDVYQCLCPLIFLYYHHQPYSILIDSCWVIDLNHTSPRILPLAIMIGDDDKVWTIWTSTFHYHRQCFNLIDPCSGRRPRLYMSTTRLMSVQDNDVTNDHCCNEFLRSYQTMALRPKTLLDFIHGYRFFLHSVMPYTSDIAVLYLSWWRPMTSLAMYHITHWIYILGHGLWSHELIDCNILVPDRDRLNISSQPRDRVSWE